MNKLILLFSFLILFVNVSVQAQITDSIPIFDFSEIKDYEIGKIDVIGSEFTDNDAIIGISGLKVGNVITIPGRAIPDAMKSLIKLKLFTDVRIQTSKIIGDVIFLEIVLEEEPRYFTHSFKTLKKGFHEDVNKIIKAHLRRNTVLTDDVRGNIKQKIFEFFKEKGYLNTEIAIEQEPFEKRKNAVKLIFDINLNERVKIASIKFEGNGSTPDQGLNKKLTDAKLRKQFDNTKQKKRFLTKSKYVEDDFEIDKKILIAYYNKLGLRDAKITGSKVEMNDDGELELNISIFEGGRYYFRKINWEGNTIYDKATLSRVLGIEKGDVYNPELLEKRLRFSEDSRDVSSLYMDDGYLFFNVDPVEIVVAKDSIDLDMLIYEGPQATIDKVTIRGNDRTHEHVIRRILRTHPGEKFSRSEIIRSQREILALGFFDPEQLQINTPVNAQRGTVDIEYDLVERPSDQLELSAGYNGYAGLLGTIGVTFNNFSIRRAFEPGAWKPVPMGDGQKLSLRAQSNGQAFRSANFSFTEPWLGGKKANSFTVGGNLFGQALGTINKNSASYGQLTSSAVFVALGSRLKWPDDYFISSTTLYYQNYSLKKNAYFSDGSSGIFRFEGNSIFRGSFNNIYLGQTFTRSSINEPLFPTRGSKFSLAIQITPPYSLFKKDNYWKLSEEEATVAIQEENLRRDRYLGTRSDLNEFEANAVIFNKETANRFKYLEYHKWRFDAEWYTPLFGKFVLRSVAKMGFLGYWDKDVGIAPFERFQLGGDGLSNQNTGIQGVDIIRLRGYEVSDIEDRNGDGITDNSDEAIVFNKFELELRYPISANPNSTIFVLGFLEGGNSYTSFSDYRPFDLRRSAGVGLRVFLPVFGLLGFDYGFGFDKPNLIAADAAYGEYAKFGLIIGFEPD